MSLPSCNTGIWKSKASGYTLLLASSFQENSPQNSRTKPGLLNSAAMHFSGAVSVRKGQAILPRPRAGRRLLRKAFHTEGRLSDLNSTQLLQLGAGRDWSPDILGILEVAGAVLAGPAAHDLQA